MLARAEVADDVLDRLAAARDQLLIEPGVLDPGLARLAAVGLDLVLKRRSRQEEITLRCDGRRERDRLIRRLVAEFFASGPDTRSRVEALLVAARQYAATGWLRHRSSVTCPDSICGTAQELMWRAMKAHKKFPDSVSMIEKILARRLARDFTPADVHPARVSRRRRHGVRETAGSGHGGRAHGLRGGADPMG